MRVVLDTNVVLSALLWRGTPYQLLQAVRSRDDIQLFSSIALLEELAEVLLRPGPARRLALIGRDAKQVIADYVEVIDIVTPLATPRVIQEDADDDHVIAAAVAAEAAVIVSGDRHLLIVGTHKTIRILQAAQVLAVLDAQPP